MLGKIHGASQDLDLCTALFHLLMMQGSCQKLWGAHFTCRSLIMLPFLEVAEKSSSLARSPSNSDLLLLPQMKVTEDLLMRWGPPGFPVKALPCQLLLLPMEVTNCPNRAVYQKAQYDHTHCISFAPALTLNRGRGEVKCMLGSH